MISLLVFDLLIHDLSLTKQELCEEDGCAGFVEVKPRVRFLSLDQMAK